MEILDQAVGPNPSANVSLLLLASIDQRWEKYKTELKKFRQEPAGDTVRTLRVATRRLRTLLSVLNEFQSYKPLKKLMREYKRNLNDLDQLRDTQVMLNEINGELAQFPDLKAFQEKLQGEEASTMRKAKKEFKKVKPGKTVKALVRWMGKADGQETENMTQTLLESIDSAYQEGCERFEQIDPADPVTIHHVRLAFKKFRYKIEALQPLLLGYPEAALECLDTYQGWMGAVQDIQVLLRSVADFAAEHPELDLEPVNRFYQQCLNDAVADYMKHKELIHDLWRPDPGQPFPWRQTNENLPAKTWNCNGA